MRAILMNGFSFRDGENVLKLIVMMVVQFLIPKNH